MDTHVAEKLNSTLKKTKEIFVKHKLYTIKGFEDHNINDNMDWITEFALESKTDKHTLQFIFHDHRGFVFKGAFLDKQQVSVSDIVIKVKMR